MSNTKPSNANNEEDANQSKDHRVIGTKEIPVIDISDEDEPLPVTKKQRRLTKNGNVINNHVVASVPSYHDLQEGLHGLDEESEDDKPLRIKRTTKYTQTSNSKKKLLKFFDDSTDDDKDEVFDDSAVFHNSFDFKPKEVVQDGDKLIDHSNDHVYHLDDFKEDEHLDDQQDNSLSKEKQQALIDEESWEDIHNKNNTSDDSEKVNINDLSQEASYGEDLHSSHSVRSESDEDEEDSFIDDESLGYYSTDDEDNDDDF